MKEWEEYLRKIYYDPSHPASFEGKKNLYQIVKQENKYKLTHQQIQKWLRSQSVYTVNRNVKRNFQRGRVIVSGIDDQWDIDLASFAKEYSGNDGYKHLLVAIDIFSRYVWIQPLKNKSAIVIVSAFKKILNGVRKPRRLRSDAGSDFTSGLFQKFCKQNNITHFTTHNEKQANYVERVIKTIKSKIYKYIHANNSERYIDVLQDIVSAYNNRWHKGIKIEPKKVNNTNENKLWWQMYWPKKKIIKTSKKPFKFNIGDQVRISGLKSTLGREYHTKWSGEVFKVSERFIRQNQPIYRIKDWFGEIVKGTFYTNEIQEVRINDDDLFTIDHIIKYRGRGQKKEVKVRWKDWPKKFDSWILHSNIEEYK